MFIQPTRRRVTGEIRSLAQRKADLRRPHRRTLKRILNLKVRIVLMPIRTHALLARLEEDLIQMQHDRVAEAYCERQARALW